MVLTPGQQAAEFSLRNQHGETVALSARSGRPVAVMFYPFAFSRVCGSELAQIHQRWAEFADIDAALLAISCEPVHTLRAYAEALSAESSEDHAQGLGFELLSDFWPHGEVAQAYDSFDAEKGCPVRNTFIFDPGQRITQVISSPMGQPRDLDEVLAALARAR